MKYELLTDEQLVKLAGEAAFEKAKKLDKDCSVEDFSLAGDKASGRFEGRYTTSIQQQRERLEGRCNCPSSEGFDFCHHCVLLAFQVRQSSKNLEVLSKGPEKSRVLAYLLTLDKSVLAKQMLALLEQNSDEFQRYVLKASLDGGEPDYAALKKELTTLTRSQEKLFSQRQVAHFFARIERFLAEVEEVLAQAKPVPMLRLIEYAVLRVNRVLDKLEDRQQLRAETQRRLSAMYAELFARLSGRDETLAKKHASLWLKDVHGLLGLEAMHYLDVHGSGLQKIFEEVLLTEWGALEKDTEQQGSLIERKLARYFLDTAGEPRSVGIDLRSQLRMKEALAVSAQDYLSIALEWHRKEKFESAISVLESAVSKGLVAEELVSTLTAFYVQSYAPKTRDKLLELLQQHPDVVCLRLHDHLVGESRHPELWQDLIEPLAQNTIEPSRTLLIDILLMSHRGEEALRVINQGDLIDVPLVERVMVALGKNYIDECEQLLMRHISGYLDRGLISADKKAAQLLNLMEGLASPARFDRFVEHMQRHFRKRPKFVESYEQIRTNTLT